MMTRLLQPPRPPPHRGRDKHRRQRLPRRYEVLTGHWRRTGLAVDQARETPWTCSLTHDVEKEKAVQDHDLTPIADGPEAPGGVREPVGARHFPTRKKRRWPGQDPTRNEKPRTQLNEPGQPHERHERHRAPLHTAKQAQHFLRAMTGIEQRPNDAQQGIEIRGCPCDDPFHPSLLVLLQAHRSPAHRPSGHGRGGPSSSTALRQQGLLVQHRSEALSSLPFYPVTLTCCCP